MKTKLTAPTAVLLLLCATAVLAEDRLGVTVYPGAKYDDADTKFAKKNCVHITCEEIYLFITSASQDTVLEFYKSHKDLILYPENGEGTYSFVSKASGAILSVQSPLPEFITGGKGTTLITINSLPKR